MPSINKIQVNNTTYEIVPGNTDYQFCIEEGYIDTNNSGGRIFLPSDKAYDENYTYYGVENSTNEATPINQLDFCYKVNNVTGEIALVALIDGDFSDTSNLIVENHLVRELPKVSLT